MNKNIIKKNLSYHSKLLNIQKNEMILKIEKFSKIIIDAINNNKKIG